MDLQKVGCEGWIGLIWLRVSTCECGNVTSGSVQCGVFLEWLKTG
jgi:hypothetical protein